jgi:uncharacterized protein
MRFEWDEAKNEINRRKHDIRFEIAVEVFDDPMAKSVQDREIEGEARWQTIGLVRDMRMVIVAHTSRDRHGEEIVRIISARKAERAERRLYEEDK